MFARFFRKRNTPGELNGRRHTTYVDEVKALRSAGNEARAEFLLLALVDAVEAEHRANGLGLAPWYTEQLAIIYHERKDYAAEVAILERYERHYRAKGPSELATRLAQAREARELARGRA